MTIRWGERFGQAQSTVNKCSIIDRFIGVFLHRRSVFYWPNVSSFTFEYKLFIVNVSDSHRMSGVLVVWYSCTRAHGYRIMEVYSVKSWFWWEGRQATLGLHTNDRKDRKLLNGPVNLQRWLEEVWKGNPWKRTISKAIMLEVLNVNSMIF